MTRWLVLLGGGIWGIVRFAAIFAAIVTIPSAAPHAHGDLLWFGSPAVVLAALFFSAAYHPHMIRSLLPMLRIGMAASVVSDAAVIMTRSYSARLMRGGIPETGSDRLLFFVTFTVLAVDLFLTSVLLWYRPQRVSTKPPEHLPDYDPARMDE